MADKLNPYGAKSARKGIKNQLLARVIQAGAGLLIVLITVRSMSIADYAAYVTATAAGSLIGSLSLFGLDRAAFRYLPEGRLNAHPGDLRRMATKIQNVRYGMLLVLGVGVFAVWPWLGPRLQMTAETMLLPVIAFGTVHAVAQFNETILQSLMLQRGIRDATFITWFSRLAALIFAVLSLGTLPAALALWITTGSEALGAIWMGFIAKKNLKQLDSTLSDRTPGTWLPDWKRMKVFALQNYVMGQAALAANPRVQTLVAAAFLSQEAVAAYGFFRNLSDQFARALPFHMLRTVIEPVLIGNFQSNKDFARVNSGMSVILKMNLILSVPVAIWAWLAAGPMVRMLTDGKFLDSLWVLPLLVLSLVPSTQRTLQVVAVNAVDRTAVLIPATVLASLATIALLWSQVPRFGLITIVLSDIVFAAIFGYVVTRALGRSGFRYRPDWSALLKVYVVSAVLAALSRFALSSFGEVESVWQSIVVGILIALAFLVGVIRLNVFTADELTLIRRLGIAKRIPI